MRKGPIIIALIAIGFVALKVSTDNKEAKRQEIISTTNDPAELVAALVNSDDAKPNVNITRNPQGALSELTVSYSAHFSKNEDEIWSYNYNLEKISKTAFGRFPSLSRINVTVNATLVDLRGNKTFGPVLRSTFTRANAMTVHWDNVQVENVPKIADQYWIHPAMLRKD